MDILKYLKDRSLSASQAADSYVNTANTGMVPLSPEQEAINNLSFADRLNRLGDQMHDKLLPNEAPRSKPMALYKEQFGPEPASLAGPTPPEVSDVMVKPEEQSPAAQLISTLTNRKPAASPQAKPQANPVAQPFQAPAPQAMPSEELEDQELLDAQENRNFLNFLSALGKTGVGIGSAISGSTNTSGANAGFAALDSAAENQIKDVVAKREQKDKAIERQKKQLDLSDDMQMAKSDSPVSKTLREGYELVTGQKLPENVSGSLLRATGINLGSLMAAKLQADANKEAAKQRAADKEERLSDRRDLRDREFEAKIDNKIEKLDQKFKESTTYIDQANAQIELAVDNPQAATNLARNIIKAVEGAGARVSDKDFTSAVGDSSLAGKMADKINGLSKGTIRKVTERDLREMISASEKVMKQKFEESRDLVIKNYAKTSKRDINEIRKGYGVEAPADKAAQPKLVEQDGNVFQLDESTGEYKFLRKK